MWAYVWVLLSARRTGCQCLQQVLDKQSASMSERIRRRRRRWPARSRIPACRRLFLTHNELAQSRRQNTCRSSWSKYCRIPSGSTPLGCIHHKSTVQCSSQLRMLNIWAHCLDNTIAPGPTHTRQDEFSRSKVENLGFAYSTGNLQGKKTGSMNYSIDMNSSSANRNREDKPNTRNLLKNEKQKSEEGLSSSY